MRINTLMLSGLLLLLTGCSGTIEQQSRPIGEVAAQFEAPLKDIDASTYPLGPNDKISIRTFREPDLSFDEITLDSTGAIAFPLLGRLDANGDTVFELARQIESGLGQVYLRNPDVTVMLLEAATRRIVVEGAVNSSGVFSADKDMTLLGAIARARGTNELASRDDVVVFRTIEGQRFGALFNLTAIERGMQDDPQLISGDVVVVHLDNARRDYLELLRASPLAAAVFRAL